MDELLIEFRNNHCVLMTYEIITQYVYYSTRYHDLLLNKQQNIVCSGHNKYFLSIVKLNKKNN